MISLMIIDRHTADKFRNLTLFEECNDKVNDTIDMK